MVNRILGWGLVVLVLLAAGAYFAFPKFFSGIGAENPRLAAGGSQQSGVPTAPEQGAAGASGAGEALPAEKTGGFDGARAFEHVRQLVAIGARTPGSAGSARAQEYILGQLKSSGCAAEEQAFSAQTPLGRVGMKNILVKIPGASRGTILLMTHYDTLRRENTVDGSGARAEFVGANDSGSSTGVMLELARLLCPRRGALSVWIAFLDGEEAIRQWSEADSVYGSRQLAASLALSGELKNLRAVILADMVGDRQLNILHELNSTPWLMTLVLQTARRLGYEREFSGPSSPIEDDHLPFLKRGVPAVDLIDLDYPPWHTASDTLDKVSARSLAVVGHVILEVIPAIENRPKEQPPR